MTVPVRLVALGEQLAGALRDRIIRGSIAPGTHLVEDAIAAEYDISRGPVRDALRTLQTEGLVEPRRRGYHTRPFTEEDVEELYQVRGAAERLACSLALSRDDADWGRAEGFMATMRTAADAGDSHAYATADLAFHTEFYRNSGNARLLALWQQFQPTFATLLDITNAQDADLHPSCEDHARMLQLATTGALEQLIALLENHLDGSRRRILAAIHGG